MKSFRNDFIKIFWENSRKYKGQNCIYIGGKYFSYEAFAKKVMSIYNRIDEAEGNKARIGVLSYKNVDTYASILAILSYGSSYVPVNNKYPLLRNKNLLKKGAVKLLISSEENEDILSYYKSSGIGIISSETQENNLIDTIEPKVEQDEVYLMFTSGSTGEPKGVPVSNKNIDHFLSFMCNSGIYDFNEKDRFLQMFDLTFDASLMCMFVPLMKGACFYVPEDGPAYAKAIELIEHKNLTVALMVPSLLDYLRNYLQEITLPTLRYSFFGGERLSVEMAKKWLNCVPNAIVENLYGPTEAAIWCSRYRLIINEFSSQGNVSIGKLFSDMNYILINEDNREVESQGELCLAGEQVIGQYLNNENSNSFFDNGGVRYYRTGDIVSLDDEKNLHFIGRLDNQLKINGYRVNLKRSNKI